MYPNETAEHHKDHRCRNKEVNQFCYDPISKYRGNFCGCITRHHPVWAGYRSWVSRHLSLHLSIRGDEVRVRSCLIFRYRIWPKKQCVMEKHSYLLQKYNSCRLLLTITHKYLSSHETRKHRHIFARVAAFWQRVFQTLPNLDVHPGVAVYHTLKIFLIVNAKDLLMPHTKFQVCTLKINTIFCHSKKKIPLLLNRSVHMHIRIDRWKYYKHMCMLLIGLSCFMLNRVRLLFMSNTLANGIRHYIWQNRRKRWVISSTIYQSVCEVS